VPQNQFSPYASPDARLREQKAAEAYMKTEHVNLRKYKVFFVPKRPFDNLGESFARPKPKGTVGLTL